MRYKKLGNTPLSVSEISFGCMSLGDDHVTNSAILHYALDQGINYFDTADVYQNGNNEITIGKAFANSRDKVIIATKVGNQPKPDGSAGFDWNPRKTYILQAVEKSLTRLQTDYIDLYQLHGGTIDDPIDETIEAFELLQKQGKIRYYGISSIRPNVIREYVKRSSISSVMMQYSLLDRRPEESCLDLLKQKNISVLVRGAVAKGLLVDKQPQAYLNYSADDVGAARDAVASVSNAQRSPTESALKFVLHHGAVTSAVVGIRTREQLQATLGTSNAPALSPKDLDVLRSAVVENFYDQHR